MAWVQQHDIDPVTFVCVHCGAKTSEGQGVGASCRPRLIEDVARARAVSAMDDIDAIHSRLLELRAETEAALKRQGG